MIIICPIKQLFVNQPMPQDIFNDSFYNTHPVFHLDKDVQTICQSLFNAINVNYFDYARIYPDKSFVCLSSDGKWVEHFFKNNFVLGGTLKTSGMHLWESYQKVEVIRDATNNFNQYYGISIYYQKEVFIESFSIAAPKENRKILSIYLNHFEVLENFFVLFLEKAKPLIQKVATNLITIPQNMHGQIDEVKMLNEFNTLLLKEAKYNHSIIENVNLTPRELSCFRHLLLGKSAKVIGKELGISNRTVEIYIQNIKKKYNCRSAIELISRFSSVADKIAE